LPPWPSRTDPGEAEKASDPAEKVICKRFNETGSLVKSTRVCKTKADWERERDALRAQNTGASCGNAGSTGSC
jgi:hypothetical protein